MHIILKLAGVIDWSIMLAYVLVMLGIGILLKRSTKTSSDFSFPDAPYPRGQPDSPSSPPTSAPRSHRHGRDRRQVRHDDQPLLLRRRHPAMVFLAVFMIPFYYGSKARSVPEFLRLRFDEKTRAFNAIF